MGKRNGGGEVEGVKKGTKEGGEVVGQTREKEGKRRGESGWLGGEGGSGGNGGREGRGKDMHLYNGISPYKSTIQFYHTRLSCDKI